ncbi:PaaI family thioesterase [Noviherbaspirillum sp. CPCC 100848]|uniref:PaaI family thioesterase n=1 Tax=Noviherbaspirillum album TaxID=3080276 RepID=A0ABU6J4Y5_9BURK|nr:PaaI family thioesterase [Noviherbaspirillum sp. CPCC 100848]MEC4718575.1 PaaI family thioesterase [Noviherbaspirillum sp. CPCC 100848]
MQPANPAYAEVLQKMVLAMPMARELGLQFRRIEAGEVDIFIPYREAWSFRPGQMQATAIFAAADFAAVAAAGTLLPEGWINASIDCTLKIVGPANGDALLARGRVVDAGRLLSVCAADVFALRDGKESLCATALATARNIEEKTR